MCRSLPLPGRPLQRLESSGHAEVWLEAAKAAVAAELRGAACTVCPLGTIHPTAALHALDAGFNRRWCPRSQARVGLGGGDATLSEGRLWGFCSGRLELQCIGMAPACPGYSYVSCEWMGALVCTVRAIWWLRNGCYFYHPQITISQFRPLFERACFDKDFVIFPKDS